MPRWKPYGYPCFGDSTLRKGRLDSFLVRQWELPRQPIQNPLTILGFISFSLLKLSCGFLKKVTALLARANTGRCQLPRWHFFGMRSDLDPKSSHPLMPDSMRPCRQLHGCRAYWPSGIPAKELPDHSRGW